MRVHAVSYGVYRYYHHLAQRKLTDRPAVELLPSCCKQHAAHLHLYIWGKWLRRYAGKFHHRSSVGVTIPLTGLLVLVMRLPSPSASPLRTTEVDSETCVSLSFPSSPHADGVEKGDTARRCTTVRAVGLYAAACRALLASFVSPLASSVGRFCLVNNSSPSL